MDDSVTRKVSLGAWSSVSSWHAAGGEDTSFAPDPRDVKSLHAHFRQEQFWRAPKANFAQLSWSKTSKSKGKFMLEAVSIFSNILAGPGILQFPAMVTEAGWLASVLFLVLFAVLTARTCCLLAKALKQMVSCEQASVVDPALCPRFELSDLVQETFGRRAFLAFQVVLNLGMLLLCLASVVAAGATVDRLFTVAFGNSYVLAFAGDGSWIQSACPAGMSRSLCGTNLFESTTLGISAGYVAVMAVCLPLTFTNFANLMWFQYVALAVSFMSVMTFVLTCFMPNDSDEYAWHLPAAIGADPGFAISTCFLSFAIAFAVPSWWNENEVDCPAPAAIKSSMVYTLFVYYLPVALLPACAFVIPQNQTALDLFLNGKVVNAAAVLAAYMLAILGIMPNVVAYSVAMRDNLQAIGPFFDFRMSLLIGCLGPFFVGWALDDPTGFGGTFSMIVNWSSLLLLGSINFIVPLLVVCKLSREQQREQSTLLAAKCEPWTWQERWEAHIMLAVSAVLVVGGYTLKIVN